MAQTSDQTSTQATTPHITLVLYSWPLHPNSRDLERLMGVAIRLYIFNLYNYYADTNHAWSIQNLLSIGAQFLCGYKINCECTITSPCASSSQYWLSGDRCSQNTR